jgi:diguanylate cyclase (GGDEF)-like protein
MTPHATERILLIGDSDRQIHSALAQALPGAQLTSVGGVFDGIAELSSAHYTAVLAAAEPIERRPEAAVRTLRKVAGDSRLLLFGHPTLEPLSRKMLNFGCDDYIVTPANPQELQQMFTSPPLRLAESPEAAAPDSADALPASPPGRIAMLLGLPLAEILLDALVQHPQNAPAAAVEQINSRIAPVMRLHLASEQAPPPVPEAHTLLSHLVRQDEQKGCVLHLIMPRDEDETAARHFLAQLAFLIGKVATLEDRHAGLQKLAITDDLTGIYNGRYFRHFLARILERARVMRFPVTLLLFDIDNFKKYNDTYGHGVGDEILKQTAALMRRCCREHDLVARISGDEFAVVFWDKDGPRQPHDVKSMSAARTLQAPIQIIDRFRRLLQSTEFGGVLGPQGKGELCISGGLAVYPYDANTVEALIEAADRELMFGAKKSGKNSCFIVGRGNSTSSPTP